MYQDTPLELSAALSDDKKKTKKLIRGKNNFLFIHYLKVEVLSQIENISVLNYLAEVSNKCKD